MFLFSGGLFLTLSRWPNLIFRGLKSFARQRIKTSPILVMTTVVEKSARRSQMLAVMSRTQFASSSIQELSISEIKTTVPSTLRLTKVTLFWWKRTDFLPIIWQTWLTTGTCAFHTLSEVKNGLLQRQSIFGFTSKFYHCLINFWYVQIISRWSAHMDSFAIDYQRREAQDVKAGCGRVCWLLSLRERLLAHSTFELFDPERQWYSKLWWLSVLHAWGYGQKFWCVNNWDSKLPGKFFLHTVFIWLIQMDTFALDSYGRRSIHVATYDELFSEIRHFLSIHLPNCEPHLLTDDYLRKVLDFLMNNEENFSHLAQLIKPEHGKDRFALIFGTIKFTFVDSHFCSQSRTALFNRCLSWDIMEHEIFLNRFSNYPIQNGMHEVFSMRHSN